VSSLRPASAGRRANAKSIAIRRRRSERVSTANEVPIAGMGLEGGPKSEGRTAVFLAKNAKAAKGAGQQPDSTTD
jgi:hypothetical protein